MEMSTVEILSEVFTGSGNNEEDSKSIAEVRYETWRKELRRKKNIQFEEINKSYTFDEKNSVYCKCTLIVNYTITIS